MELWALMAVITIVIAMPGPAVCAAFEPAVQARWALEGFMTKAPRRLDGKEGYYRTVFDCALLPKVKREHAAWDLGDCTGRAVLSWDALRKMTGDATTGRKVERGQREYLLSLLHPETGLVYYQADPARKTYDYQIWDQSRTLRALVQWYKTRPEDRARIKPLVERMIRGLERFATLCGVDPAWGPWLSWPSDTFTNDQPGPAFLDGDNLREGLSIEPLVEYAELTKNPKILDLAVRYTNCVMGGHAGDNVAGSPPLFSDRRGRLVHQTFPLQDHLASGCRQARPLLGSARPPRPGQTLLVPRPHQLRLDSRPLQSGAGQPHRLDARAAGPRHSRNLLRGRHDGTGRGPSLLRTVGSGVPRLGKPPRQRRGDAGQRGCPQSNPSHAPIPEPPGRVLPPQRGQRGGATGGRTSVRTG